MKSPEQPPSFPPDKRPRMADAPELIDPRPHRSRLSSTAEDGSPAVSLGSSLPSTASSKNAERWAESKKANRDATSAESPADSDDVDNEDDKGDDSPAVRERKEERPEKKGGCLKEAFIIVVVALTVSMLVKTFLIQSFFIPSVSMESTLEVDDRILVNKLANREGELRRGDVVVFVDPGGWLPPQTDTRSSGLKIFEEFLTFIGIIPFHAGEHLVKRIIGLPGDRVTCCDPEGRLEVNGVAIDEGYLKDGSLPSEMTFDVEVPEGKLWLMGDNRQNSRDSRAHLGAPGGGFVPIESVEGRVAFIMYPFDRLAHLGGESPVFSDVPSR